MKIVDKHVGNVYKGHVISLSFRTFLLKIC